MSTTSQTPASTEDQQVDAATAHAQQVEQRAQKTYAALQRAELKKAPAERAKDGALWKQAHREASRQVYRERATARTKQLARSAATSTYSETKSVVQRNRRQLAPWATAAPYAVLGASAWAVATHSPSASPIGIAVLAAAITVGASVLAWRWRLASRVPARFHPKLQAGLGMLCGWCAGMPLVPSGAGQAGMWLALLALLAGIGYMGLSWWREHDHPIPPQPAKPAEQQRHHEPTDEASRRTARTVETWHRKVAPAGKAVPGSAVTHVSSTDVMDRYLVALDDEGQVTRSQLNGLKDRIEMPLGIPKTEFTFESTTHPAQVIMRHLHQDPVFAYQGPIVLCDGKPIASRREITPGSTVDIVFGSYLDGDGYACYRVLEKGSVNSAFVLGGMGSGKTRTVELIAIGLRMLGCYLLWIDGQEGASSPLLNRQANQVFEFNMHDDTDDCGVREFADTLGAIARKRNRDLKEKPELNGEYTYDPHRPPVVAIMDEAHAMLQKPHPKHPTYGMALEQNTVQLRKSGMGLIALSQDLDKPTFGNSSRIRQSLMISGNFLGMRQIDKSRIGMLPSSCPPLDTVPPGRGYGYLPLGERPDALWRTLDLGEDTQATAERWMSAYDLGVLEFDLEHTASAGAEAAGAEPDRVPVESSLRVVHFPTTGTPEPDEPDRSATVLTEAEQTALEHIRQEPQTPTMLASRLGVSQQAAGKTLRKLAAKGDAARIEDSGRYRVTS